MISRAPTPPPGGPIRDPAGQVGRDEPKKGETEERKYAKTFQRRRATGSAATTIAPTASQKAKARRAEATGAAGAGAGAGD